MAGAHKTGNKPPVWRQRKYQVAAGVCGAAVIATGAIVAEQGGFTALTHAIGLGHSDQGSGGHSGTSSNGAMPGGTGRGSAAPSGSASPGSPGATGGTNGTNGTTGPNGTHGTTGPTGKPGTPTPHTSPTEKAQTIAVTIGGVPATETNSGSMPESHHTLRVVSARGNLWGQRELSWVADSGHQVGDARCTQNFVLGTGSTPRVRPTMLICWRTSATKSVYTVAVDVDQRPSEQASVAALDQAWQALG